MPYDYPDHEDRQLPHGDMLLAGDTFAVPGGGINLPGISGFLDVGAYRSLQVVVNNHGASDIDFLVTWDWYNATVHLQPTETQRVLAGTTRRMLFRNQGDIVDSVKATPTGAGGNVDYYVAGSNHDPLPGSAPDYILMTGVAAVIPAVVGGASGQVPWNHATFKTNDASLWAFTLDGGGNIVQVKTTQPGRYESLAVAHFDAPAAAVGETFSMSISSAVVVNVTTTVAVHTANVYEAMTGVFGEHTSGTTFFETDYSFDVNTTGLIRGEWWWIKRFPLPA